MQSSLCIQPVVPIQECRATAHKLRTEWFIVTADPTRRPTMLIVRGIVVRRSTTDKQAVIKSWSLLFLIREKVTRIMMLLMSMDTHIMEGITAYTGANTKSSWLRLSPIEVSFVVVILTDKVELRAFSTKFYGKLDLDFNILPINISMDIYFVIMLRGQKC